MAVGVLNVKIGADAAEFVQGMTKAEAQAKAFSQRIQGDIKAGVLKAQLAMEALGQAANAVGNAFSALKDHIEGVAKFQELAEKVGDTASNLASLKTASDVSGVSMDTLGSAMVKLSSNMAKTDEEGQGAANALRALGLSFKDFQGQSPTERMSTLAKTFGEFQDSADKSAIAVALFGKAGADLLPMFNDLNEYGKGNIQLTEGQIKAANDLSEQLALLKSNGDSLYKSLAADLAPTLSDLITAFFGNGKSVDDTKAKYEGLRKVVDFFVEGAKNAMIDIVAMAYGIKAYADSIAGLGRAIGAALTGDFEKARAINKQVNEEFAATIQKSKDLQVAIKNAGNEKANADPFRLEGDKGLKKKLAPFSTAKQKTESGGGDKTTDGERYLKTLEHQLQGVKKLSAEEKALDEIASGRIKNITSLEEQRILQAAKKIDTINLQKAANDALFAQEEQAAADKLAADLALNDSQKKIAENRMAYNAQAMTDLEILHEFEAQLLRDLEANNISQDNFNRLMGKTKEQIEALEPGYINMAKVGGEALTALADGLAGAIANGKSLADVFKGVVRQLAAMIVKALLLKALGFLVDGIFGAGTASKIGLGGKAGGGDVNSNTSYMVGEKGPEIFTPKQSGRITPNNQLNKMGSMRDGTKSNVYNITAPGVSREEFMSGLNRSQQGAVSDVRDNRLRRRA